MAQPNFEPIAQEALQTLDLIETIATEKLQSIGSASAESFANANTFTGAQAVQNLSNINEQNRVALAQLKNEPALVRLVVEHEDGVRETLYIARKTQVPLIGDIKLASYMIHPKVALLLPPWAMKLPLLSRIALQLIM